MTGERRFGDEAARCFLVDRCVVLSTHRAALADFDYALSVEVLKVELVAGAVTGLDADVTAAGPRSDNTGLSSSHDVTERIMT